MTFRQRRNIVAATATGAGFIDVLLAAFAHPVLVLDDVQIHLGEPGDLVSRFVLLIAAAGFLASIRGLRRGNRLAWDVSAVATALGFIATQARDADGFGVVAGFAMVVALAVSWSACTGRSERPSVRRGLRFLSAGLLGAYLYGVAGLYLLDAEFSISTTLLGSLTDAARVMVWVSPTNVGVSTPAERLFVDTVRFVVVLVCVVAAVLVMRAARVKRASPADRADARGVLEQEGRNGLAYFNLLDDKLYCFTDDRVGFLSYKVIGDVAIALGDPVGPPERASDVLDCFLAKCVLEGLEPCLHQAGPAYLDLYRSRGLAVLKIGEEAIIDVNEFSVDQPGMKTVRKKSNKLRRDGVTVEELATPIDDATMRELREVSDVWLQSGGHRERSFTLGRFDPDYLRDTTVLVARTPGVDGQPGRIEAFVNLLPRFGGDDGNFDLMRRRSDAPGSVMDLLFVTMIEQFRAEGRSGMNLGLAPLAGITGTAVADRVTHMLYDRADRLFNFQGLYEFKDKWNPNWEERFLVARTSTALAKVAPAIAVVGEHDDPVTRHPYMPAVTAVVKSPRQLVAAIAHVPRRSDAWLFGVLVGLIIAVQVATIGQASRFDRWHAAFAVSWDDVKQFRVLRVATSSLIQTVPGMVWSIVAFAVVASIGVLWRIGGRRAVAVWFVSDMVATVLLYLSTQLVALAGIAAGDKFLKEHDSGSSSAFLAVMTAAVMTLGRRTRNVLLAALMGLQVVFLVATGKSAYLHHMIAITLAVGFVMQLDRRRSPHGLDADDGLPVVDLVAS